MSVASIRLLQYAHTMDKCLLVPVAAQRRYNNSAGTAAGVDDLVASDVDANVVDITVSLAGETDNVSHLEL